MCLWLKGLGARNFLVSVRNQTLLSEHKVISEWRKLFNGSEITSGTLAEAERLIDELSLETPLRFRLGRELDDIRTMLLRTDRRKTP